MRKIFTTCLSVLIALMLISTAGTSSATSLLPISLENLSTRANTVFYAEVISNESKLDPQSGQIATYTEFRVIEAIKGHTEATHTIKQIGGYDKNSKRKLQIHGVPRFDVGKEYIVFLPKASSLGFCSPIGLYQGSFSVATVDGEKIVRSGKDLSQQHSTPALSRYSLTPQRVQVPLAVSADDPSQSNLNDFINTVRTYNTP